MLIVFYGNNTDRVVYLTIINRKAAMPTKTKAAIHKLNTDANIPLARLHW
tara:strand:+ start:540 stop:689 length:150 start_codon:yes stop_codon:yes gene_type:complete